MVFSSWFTSHQQGNKSRQQRVTRSRLQLETLEDRTVPTVTLGTALGIGHDLGSSKAFAVVADSTGNSYMTGFFSGTTDFDSAHTYPGNTDILTARGSGDAFVAKYAPDSSLVWVQRMGGDAPLVNGAINDTGRSLVLDGSGNIYVVGQFIGSADFGSTTLLTSGDGVSNGFIAKLNSSGTVLWANRWGTTAGNSADSVGVDAAGNVYASVSTYSSSNPALTGSDILKYTSTGTLLWNKYINTRLTNSLKMAVNSSGNVYLGGLFSGTVDFDPGNGTKYVTSGNSNGYYSGFVLKLTTAGNYGWVSPFIGLTVGTSNGASMVNSIALDGSGNLIVDGWYRGPVDFNPGNGTTILPTEGGGFITKFNSSGGLIWAESTGNASVGALTLDATGSIYVTGSFSGTVDFDPGAGTTTRTSVGSSDLFVMKMNSAGNFNWVETLGGSSTASVSSIALDPLGTIHLVGWYKGTVNFDPTDIYFLTNPGPYSNMFLVRLRQT